METMKQIKKAMVNFQGNINFFVDGEKARLNEAKTWVSDTKPKTATLRKALGIPEGKNISDVYTIGKKLAEDLVKKIGKK